MRFALTCLRKTKKNIFVGFFKQSSQGVWICLFGEPGFHYTKFFLSSGNALTQHKNITSDQITGNQMSIRRVFAHNTPLKLSRLVGGFKIYRPLIVPTPIEGGGGGGTIYSNGFFLFRQFWPIDIFIVEVSLGSLSSTENGFFHIKRFLVFSFLHGVIEL